MNTRDDARFYVKQQIGPTAGHFDLDALVPALRTAAGSYDIDGLPSSEFWRIANRHQIRNIAA